MSFTNETTHYGIPKPLGTDLTTPMDYNTAADAVDTALWNASTGASEATSVAAEAKTIAEGAASDVTTLDGTVTTLSGTVATQGAAITALQNGVADVRQDLSDAIEAVTEPSATATYAHAVKDLFWYNNTLYRTTAPISIGDTIVPDTNCTTTTVATELARVEAEITTPTASGVTFDPTGTTFPDTATDVDKALKAVAPRGNVTVSATATTTFGQLMVALANAIDFNKIMPNTVLTLRGNANDVYQLDSWDSSRVLFTRATVRNNTDTTTIFVVSATSPEALSGAGSTFTDLSSASVGSITEAEIIY